MNAIHELPSFDISPSQLEQIAITLVEDVQSATKRLTDTVTPQDATFENVICPLADVDNELKGKVQFLAIFQAVSPSLELRQGSSAAVSMVDTTYLELFQNENLFALVDAVYNSRHWEQLEVEDQKYLTKLHSTFLDNGLGLKGDDKKRFHRISKRLVELRVAFTENLGLDPGYVWKTEDEFEGLGAKRFTHFPCTPRMVGGPYL